MNRHFLIGIIIALTVIFDQLTKIVARDILGAGIHYTYLNHMIQIFHSENTGAFLSLGANLPEELRFWIFCILVTVGLSYFTWSTFRNKLMPTSQTIAMSLIIGGGIGNLIDRFGRGSVTDFLNVGIGSLRTGVFNVADMAVTTGAIIMFLMPLVEKFKKKTPVD